VLGRSSLDPQHLLTRIYARCIEWATAPQESAEICANIRGAQALVGSDSNDVYIEPPLDCEKYKRQKNNVQRKYILDTLNNWEIFLGRLRLRILFYKIEANAENRGSLPTSAFSGLLSAAQHTRGLAIARICGLRANRWQLPAMLHDSAHMAGNHVRKSKKASTWLAAMCGLPAFLLYTHTQNPGTCVTGTPIPGLGATTPGTFSLHSEPRWRRLRC
jgi:hypothetical protein